jgi:hypothetical protein
VQAFVKWSLSELTKLMSRSRVCHVIIVDRFLHSDMRIFLRAAETRVSQAFPEVADLHPVLHAMCRKAVSQTVRSHLGIDAREL